MIEDKDFRDFHYNILGARSTIIGDVTLSGDTIINSHISGSIEIENGKLTLERGSFVRGKIKAADLEIFGSIDGEIDCTGLVSIRSSAQVQGKIKSGRLVIYPGAVVEMDASSEV